MSPKLFRVYRDTPGVDAEGRAILVTHFIYKPAASVDDAILAVMKKEKGEFLALPDPIPLSEIEGMVNAWYVDRCPAEDQPERYARAKIKAELGRVQKAPSGYVSPLASQLAPLR